MTHSPSPAGSRDPWRYPPLVIAHRGVPARFPEHTEGAFRAAVEERADVLEVDVVSTADGVLVARHDWGLSRTTDVAGHGDLAEYRRGREGPSGLVQDWWVDDLTWQQASRLRATERWPAVRPASARADGQWPLLTLRSLLALVRAAAAGRERPLGIAVEVKGVAAVAQRRGIDLLGAVLAELDRAGLPNHEVPVWVLSFEAEPLATLREARAAGEVPDVGLVQLFEHRAPSTAAQWDAIARRADLVGPAIDLVLASAGAPTADRPSAPAEGGADGDVMVEATRRGLGVWCWTFRSENAFLPQALRRGHDPRAPGNLDVQVREAIERGVAGLIGDQPALLRHLRSVGC